MSEPWNTDMWFTSPWNFDKEVRDQVHFDPNPKLHDVTLRDGEQQTGVLFTKDDKIRIAEALAEVGIHRFKAGRGGHQGDRQASRSHRYRGFQLRALHGR